MAQELEVVVVTPQRAVARGVVDMVVAPSVCGQVGILPDHRPLVADLTVGLVELYRESRLERYAVSGGFLEVKDNRVTLMAETAERSDTIDLSRAKASLADAEAKLRTLSANTEAYTEELGRRDRARNRIEAATLKS